MLDRLAALGYERAAQVEERGEVAVRGGLIDVYPSTADLPVRIEFFGDEIESVRAFSPFTQRTIRPLEHALVWPSTEPDPAHARIGPLDDPRLAAAVLVRLAPTEHGAALRAARERFADEAAAGALSDVAAITAELERRAALDLAPPTAGEAIFDAVQARFATRGQTEAEGELARLARNGHRVLVTFARRGDMERSALRLERLTPTILAPGQVPERGQRRLRRARRSGRACSRMRSDWRSSPRPRSCAAAAPRPSGARSWAAAWRASWTCASATTWCTRTTASAV